jgi:hypothetical protein
MFEKRECPLRLEALTDARVVISLVARMVDRAVIVLALMSVAKSVPVVMVEGRRMLGMSICPVGSMENAVTDPGDGVENTTLEPTAAISNGAAPVSRNRTVDPLF